MIDIIEFIISLFTPPYAYFFILGLSLFVIGVIGRLISIFRGTVTLSVDRRSSAVSHTAIMCFTLLFAYVIAIVQFGTDVHMSFFASALPFVNFDNITDGVILAITWSDGIGGFLTEVVQVFFLTFVMSFITNPVNTFSRLLSKSTLGAKIIAFPTAFFPWYFVQCIIVMAVIVVNWGLRWILTDKVSEAFAVGLPTFLYWILAIFMVLYGLKILSDLFGFATGFFSCSFFSKLTYFFKDTFFGGKLKTAFLTTLAVVAIVIAVKLFDIYVISTLAIAAVSFVPMILILICLWYVTWYLAF